MTFFGQEISIEDMPSYQSFKNSPNHLYSAMQDTLAQGLNRTAMLSNQTDTQTLGTKEIQPNAWSK